MWLNDKLALFPLAAQERQIQKVQLYLDGHVTSQGFGQFYKPAEERLNQLVAELPKLEAEVAYYESERPRAGSCLTIQSCSIAVLKSSCE